MASSLCERPLSLPPSARAAATSAVSRRPPLAGPPPHSSPQPPTHLAVNPLCVCQAPSLRRPRLAAGRRPRLPTATLSSPCTPAPPPAGLLSELVAREEKMGISPDPELDAFMRAQVGVSARLAAQHHGHAGPCLARPGAALLTSVVPAPALARHRPPPSQPPRPFRPFLAHRLAPPNAEARVRCRLPRRPLAGGTVWLWS